MSSAVRPSVALVTAKAFLLDIHARQINNVLLVIHEQNGIGHGTSQRM